MQIKQHLHHTGNLQFKRTFMYLTTFSIYLIPQMPAFMYLLYGTFLTFRQPVGQEYFLLGLQCDLYFPLQKFQKKIQNIHTKGIKHQLFQLMHSSH